MPRREGCEKGSLSLLFASVTLVIVVPFGGRLYMGSLPGLDSVLDSACVQCCRCLVDRRMGVLLGYSLVRQNHLVLHIRPSIKFRRRFHNRYVVACLGQPDDFLVSVDGWFWLGQQARIAYVLAAVGLLERGGLESHRLLVE